MTENNDEDLFAAVRDQMATLTVALARPGVQSRLADYLRGPGGARRLDNVRQAHQSLGAVLEAVEKGPVQ